jgi:DNA-binding transcriptional LysR family regulator
MELGQLRAIRELRDRGSIAAVATALRVTPSSVSQQISALQRQSVVPLTYRAGRRTALTDAGHALADAAVGVQIALTRAERAVAEFQSEPVGTVSVSAFHSAALAFFGRLLTPSGGTPQPDIRVRDFDVAQDDFPKLTAEFDLVLAHRLMGSAPWPRTVRVDSLLFEPLDIAVRRDHPLAGKSVIRPEDLRDSSWVAVQEGFPLATAVTLIASTAGTQARVLHRVNDFEVAAVVVAATDSVALLPRYLSDLRDHPDIVLRPLSNPAIGRQIDCLSRPETLERQNAMAVLAILRHIASSLGNGQGSV